MFVFFTCAFICRLCTYLLPGKPYSSKGPDSSAKKGRITTNPIWIIHVFSINMSANITRVPSYHAIPTCLLYYQERFMHFFSFCHNFPHVCFIPFLHTKTKQFSFYIRNSNNHISISYMEHMLLISP